MVNLLFFLFELTTFLKFLTIYIYTFRLSKIYFRFLKMILVFHKRVNFDINPKIGYPAFYLVLNHTTFSQIKGAQHKLF